MFDIQQMMKQAQEMQFKMQEMQEKFKEIEVEGTSGGGLVTVTITCAGSVRNVQIDDSLMGAENKEMLEDLIAAAMNQANDARESRVQQESQSMMAGTGIDPSMLGGNGGMPF